MTHASPNAILIPRTEAPGPDRHRLAGAFLSQFRSHETRKAYAHDLRCWFEFCDRYQLDAIRVTTTEINVYMRELEDKGLANATRGRRLSALKSFFGWCFDEQIIDGNPAARIRAPKRHRSNLPAIGKHEAHRFMNAADEDGDPYCAATMGLMLLAGLRVTEVCTRNVRDYTSNRWVGELHVIGKGDKARTIELPARALSTLDDALDGRQVGPLLLNQASNRINITNIRRQVQRVSERADVRTDLSPHCLRRSFIQIALDDGVPIRDVQLYVGHASANTTAIYDRSGLQPGKAPAHRVASAVA